MNIHVNTSTQLRSRVELYEDKVSSWLQTNFRYSTLIVTLPPNVGVLFVVDTSSSST